MTTAGGQVNALSIAGSDPSGGAGIQADLKTFSALGAYGMAALTALTAQNTRGVSAVQAVDAGFIGEQIDQIFADIRVDAVKIGMVGSADSVARVADRLAHHRPPWIVLDPVMVAKSGDRLIDEAATAALRDTLLPLASVITPNLPEAAVLAGVAEVHDERGMEQLGRRLLDLGPRAVMLKGGHLQGEESNDLLVDADGARWLHAARVHTRNTHGTGCTLSSALAALLPVHDGSLDGAAGAAKRYLHGALASADLLAVGEGSGPVHHFHALWGTPGGRGNSGSTIQN